MKAVVAEHKPPVVPSQLWGGAVHAAPVVTLPVSAVKSGATIPRFLDYDPNDMGDLDAFADSLTARMNPAKPPASLAVVPKTVAAPQSGRIASLTVAGEFEDAPAGMYAEQARDNRWSVLTQGKVPPTAEDYEMAREVMDAAGNTQAMIDDTVAMIKSHWADKGGA